MKKITQKLLMVSLAASVLFLASCGEDEETLPAKPTIEVSASLDGVSIFSGDSVEVGSIITFTVDITAEGGINTLWVGETSIDRATLGVTSGTTFTTYSYNLVASLEGLQGADIFAVDDSDQQSDIIRFDVVGVVGVVSSPAVRAYSEILLAAPTGDFTNQNFFSVSSGETYSGNDVTTTEEAISPTIDFGYYYGSTDMASIASPFGFESTVDFAAQVSGWTTKNNTKLVNTTLTSEDFLGVATWADIDEAYKAGTADENGIISGLTVGQVIGFETVGGVKGLIYVSDIDLGESGNGFDSDAFIDIDILAQLEEVE